MIGNKGIGGHANMLVYNLRNDVVERYETKLDKAMHDDEVIKYVDKLLKNLFPRYISPLAICPNIPGAQTIETEIPEIGTS